MRTFIHRVILSLAALLSAGPALAEDAEDAAAVRAVIADWYARVREPNPNAPWSLMAPAGVNAGPGYSVPAYLHSGSAAIRRPYLNHELSARAMQFSYGIDLLKLDPRFAKAMVWERGYFSASAAQKTCESAVSTLFVLEKPTTDRGKSCCTMRTRSAFPPQDNRPDARPARPLLFALRAGVRSCRQCEEGVAVVAA
jgi:hypothetical protein